MLTSATNNNHIRNSINALSACPNDLHQLSPSNKLHAVIATLIVTINSALGSSLPSGAVSDIVDDFSIHGTTLPVLLNSVYLIGFAIGPLVFGPLSEHLGRRAVLAGTFLGYNLFTLCCAVSPNYGVLLFFRLLTGTVASAANTVIGPVYADMYDDPVVRGRYMAYFMCTTSASPSLGPIISGYARQVNWRLSFWIGLGISAIGLPVVLTMPETYAPVVNKKLRRSSAHMLAERSVERGIEQETMSKRQEITMLFSRPFTMLVQEPIVLFTSLYLALIYAVFYLFFQAYPIIFVDFYGLSTGEMGSAFLAVSTGSGVALVVFLWYTHYHSEAFKADLPWAKQIEYRRLPLACAGGPIIAGSLFWLGFTSARSISPAVPALSGLLYGTGYQLIFMALINYLGDSYKQFSASAQAAASTVRSLVAVCLPLVAAPMYHDLGIQWACSLLGLLTLLMALIPFIFIKYGERIRENSHFYKQVLRLEQNPAI